MSAHNWEVDERTRVEEWATARRGGEMSSESVSLARVCPSVRFDRRRALHASRKTRQSLRDAMGKWP